MFICLIYSYSTLLLLRIGTQSFYMSHTDDIMCLTVNRHPNFKNVVASGQIGEPPRVLVWQPAGASGSSEPRTLSTLVLPHALGVCSVAFSPSGKLLATVGLDAQHTVCVWRWQEGTLVAQAPGHLGIC